MKRILVGLFGWAALCGTLWAQDAALVERVNRLSVYVDELLADKARHQKEILDLKREVQSLREEIQRLQGAAKREDVTGVAEAVRQLDQKHRADMELVAKQLETLAKPPATSRPAESGPDLQQGYEYTVQPGDTLSAVAKAYRVKGGVQVTVDDILRANPGLDPKRLQVGQIIFIPEP